jgi:hypothetical protein
VIIRRSLTCGYEDWALRATARRDTLGRVGNHINHRNQLNHSPDIDGAETHGRASLRARPYARADP